MQIRSNQIQEGGNNCGCGRSPTGQCIGWHGLSEEDYQRVKADWEINQYKKQAQELWNDSCTTGRSE